MAECALCKNEGPLRISHIIPAFVFRWLRRTSATGHMRAGAHPRRRVQDGLKVPLLCEECEQRFSTLERQFATQIFHPMQAKQIDEVEYAEWFLKFCVSISWRVLALAELQNRTLPFDYAQMREAQEAKRVWAKFLLDQCAHPGRFEQRLMLLGEISTASMDTPLEPNANRYFMRSIDMDIACSPNIAFTYAKIGPFALFGMIEKDTNWKGAKVNANVGTVGPKKYEVPGALFHYWMYRARVYRKAAHGIGNEQQEKVEAAVLADRSRYLGSGTFEAMRADVRMFGNAAFWERD